MDAQIVEFQCVLAVFAQQKPAVKVGERRTLVLEIGRLKAGMGLPVLDPSREAAVVRRAAELARKRGVDQELTRDVIWRIMASARGEQEG